MLQDKNSGGEGVITYFADYLNHFGLLTQREFLKNRSLNSSGFLMSLVSTAV